jgi:hypothetical protein
MWIALSDAYLSIVRDLDNPDNLLVRARVAGDIERVFPDAKAAFTPNHDYAFRCTLPRQTVVNAIAAAVADIGYSNFKNSVRDAARHAAFLNIWATMCRYQEDQLLLQQRRRAPARPVEAKKPRRGLRKLPERRGQ